MPKRGENIYKRKDNRWEARFEKGRDENGKIKYGYCYARTYKEVRLKLFSAKKLYQNNQYSRGNAKKMFSDFILDWLRVRSIGNTESTNSKYWYVINNHILPFFKMWKPSLCQQIWFLNLAMACSTKNNYPAKPFLIFW